MELELISKMKTPMVGYSVGLFKREHRLTPYIVCGIKDGGGIMDECGFWAYTNQPSANQVLTEAIHKISIVLMY